MTLQLPAIQHGSWSSVRRRMLKVVTRLLRGDPLADVMLVDGLVDPTRQPGFLVMGGVMTGGEPHFHCFMPWKSAWDALFDLPVDPTVPAPLEDRVFEASLQAPWGVLGLLSSDSQSWLIPAPRHAPFLEAVLAVWDELDAVGARYYTAVQGKSLWSVPNNLHYVLAGMGVSTEILRAPLPPGGPRALLRHTKPVN
jgi:hypothetical protein